MSAIEIDITDKVKRIAIYSTVSLIVLIICIGAAIYWWQFKGHVIAVDNAVVSGDFVKVKSKVPGFLVDVAVNNGDVVESGQLLGKIRVKVLPEHLEALKQSIDTAKRNYQEILTRPMDAPPKPGSISSGNSSTLEQARQQKEKMEKLWTIGGISSAKYQEAVMAYQQAKEQYDASVTDIAAPADSGISEESKQQLLKLAEQRISQAERDLKRVAEENQIIEIRSNFDGMVYVHDIKLEDEFAAGQELFSIGNLNNLWVEFVVAEQLGSKIALGTMVHYTIAEYVNRNFSGTVCEVIDESKNPENKDARGYRIRVSIQSDEAVDIKPGMKVSAKLSV